MVVCLCVALRQTGALSRVTRLSPRTLGVKKMDGWVDERKTNIFLLKETDLDDFVIFSCLYKLLSFCSVEYQNFYQTLYFGPSDFNFKD
uniref:Uncharacterized protein n=1 Tax=Poecilia mexicana TaxID=48701 RepID=A0A3B3YWJ9_9TELE